MENKIIMKAEYPTSSVLLKYKEKFYYNEITPIEILSVYKNLITDLSEVIISIQNRGICCTELQQDVLAEDVLDSLMNYFTADMLCKHISRMEDILELVKMRQDFEYICNNIEIVRNEE